MFRIEPSAGPEAYKSYVIAAPLSTHWRSATCAEVGCPGWEQKCETCRDGWETTVDERTELGMMQATYIRQRSGRTFREMRTGTGLVVFRFEPHQKCFANHESHKHRVRIDRPERYLVRGGDWRGNPRGERYEHVSAADWQEDFAEHQDRINKEISNG